MFSTKEHVISISVEVPAESSELPGFLYEVEIHATTPIPESLVKQVYEDLAAATLKKS